MPWFHKDVGYTRLWIIYIGERCAITPVIALGTVPLIVLALATLGDVTQIGLFLFMSLHQGKYNGDLARKSQLMIMMSLSNVPHSRKIYTRVRF